jgi:hypothetical protein
MTSRVAIWAGGVAGSAIVHGAVLALVLIAVDPEPVTEQPMPSSEIEVQAHQLERTTAREQKPENQHTETNDAAGTSVAAGAIAQSRASAIQATPDTVKASNAEIAPLEEKRRSEIINDVRPKIDPAQTAVAAAPTILPAVTQAAPIVAQAQPVSAILATASAPVRVIPAVVHSAEILPPTDNPDAPTLAVVPDAARLTQAIPAAQAAQQAQPSAKKLKAALAFSGGGEGDVDPVSLAAFQSFMQPGDVKASGDTLRDGLTELLAQVPCSRLQVGFDPETTTLQVNGHIPENGLRAPVLAALQAQMGTDITVSDKILILPRPQCGALSGIADVGLPQSTDQNTNPLVIGADAHVKVLEFVSNDRLFFDITAPDYDAWVYVDYFDADGNVLHLAPNDQVPVALSPAESALRIGTKKAGDIGLQLIIGPPYGQEITVAFAASEPLYDGLRPIIEPAAPYLEWLKTRVADARAKNDGFKGEWVYFFVTTSEQ